MYVCECVCLNSLKSLSKLKQILLAQVPWNRGGKFIQMNPVRNVFILLSAFSGDFTTNLALQCKAFSRALKIEKLKAPLFHGPKGVGATNDWCIT